VTLVTLATIFAAGFIVMTPVGPVSTICIRRSLIFGPLAGIAAGTGDAVAVAIYASIGVTGSAFFPRFLAPFTTAWHIAISVVLVLVAILMWRSRPTLTTVAAPTRAHLASGFIAALAIALANPADIVLFAALFAGLGVVVHTPVEHALFFGAFFAGGVVYWVALALFLDRWRAGLTTSRVVWLNRVCSGLMMAGAGASLASLVRAAT
jgi:putative LysE/RhtB family amino acid efflux pump